ncbi:MAG TPA: aldehyde dehydrogenase family protein [Roseiarcus sp.]|jgi:acyl-CoA reductase-like NAD-dependent aldehyde dehydrogenase
MEGTRLVDEEQFGPILPVMKFSDPEDALRRTNATIYGLGGSVWSSHKKRLMNSPHK